MNNHKKYDNQDPKFLPMSPDFLTSQPDFTNDILVHPQLTTIGEQLALSNRVFWFSGSNRTTLCWLDDRSSRIQSCNLKAVPDLVKAANNYHGLVVKLSVRNIKYKIDHDACIEIYGNLEKLLLDTQSER